VGAGALVLGAAGHDVDWRCGVGSECARRRPRCCSRGSLSSSVLHRDDDDLSAALIDIKLVIWRRSRLIIIVALCFSSFNPNVSFENMLRSF
jgi:hypothetical protein